MIVVVCSGGPSTEICNLVPYHETANVVFIGADRGAYYLLEKGIVPHAIVGDFDSVTELEWQQLEEVVDNVEKFQAEKDETDTDLALLKALTYNPSEIVLTGVTGGRLDHYEAALRSVCRLQLEYPAIRIKIVNTYNELRFLTPGTHDLDKHELFQYISFLRIMSM